MSNKKYAEVYFEREFPFFVVWMIGIKMRLRKTVICSEPW